MLRVSSIDPEKTTSFLFFLREKITVKKWALILPLDLFSQGLLPSLPGGMCTLILREYFSIDFFEREACDSFLFFDSHV